MSIKNLIEWAAAHDKRTHPLGIASNRSEKRAGAWGVKIISGPHIYDKRIGELYHYSTRMLVWNIDNPLDSEVLDWSLGWGSVSDQGGMNTAFRVLDLPYYYSRKGGPSIVSLNDRESCKILPGHIRRHPEIHLGRVFPGVATT